jgi:hypothetical protein
MSYAKFLDALNEFYKNNPGYQGSMEQAQCNVRDRWITEGKLKELVAFTIENFDTGGGDWFFKPISDVIVQEKNLPLFKQLWRGVIRIRLERVWNCLHTQTKGRLWGGDPLNILQQSALEALTTFKSGLSVLDDAPEIERVRAIYESVEKLKRPQPKTTTDKRKMDEIVFWTVMEEARSAAQDKSDFIEILRSALEVFSPKEIRNFQKIFLEKYHALNLSELWAFAFIARRSCGDDEFDYFRAWIISKGKAVYQAAIDLNMDVLIKSIGDEDIQAEELLYLGEETYESKTGEIMPSVRIKAQKMKGVRWTEQTLTKIFPDLCENLNYQVN